MVLATSMRVTSTSPIGKRRTGAATTRDCWRFARSGILMVFSMPRLRQERRTGVSLTTVRSCARRLAHRRGSAILVHAIQYRNLLKSMHSNCLRYDATTDTRAWCERGVTTAHLHVLRARLTAQF